MMPAASVSGLYLAASGGALLQRRPDRQGPGRGLRAPPRREREGSRALAPTEPRLRPRLSVLGHSGLGSPHGRADPSSPDARHATFGRGRPAAMAAAAPGGVIASIVTLLLAVGAVAPTPTDRSRSATARRSRSGPTRLVTRSFDADGGRTARSRHRARRPDTQLSGIGFPMRNDGRLPVHGSDDWHGRDPRDGVVTTPWRGTTPVIAYTAAGWRTHRSHRSRCSSPAKASSCSSTCTSTSSGFGATPRSV